MKLNKYEKTLLEGWEDNYKKSQLTLWILLALKDGPKHMKQIKAFIEKYSKKTITADDKSMYRALRRFQDADLVDVVVKPVKGPDLKIQHLTQTGLSVLNEFVDRNIKQIYLKSNFKSLLK